MKHFYLLITIVLLHFSENSRGQCNNFDNVPFNGGSNKYCIENITVAYSNDKFIITGFDINGSFIKKDPLLPDPALAVFIQTGDGNYISKTWSPEFVAGAVPTIEIPYFYASTTEIFNATAEITKNYDGGGPRKSQAIQVPAKSISTGPPPLPNNAFKFLSYPGDIVENDPITLVISYGQPYPIGTKFILKYNKDDFNNLFVDGEPYPDVQNGQNGYKEVKLTNPQGYKNVFIRIRPGKNLQLNSTKSIQLFKLAYDTANNQFSKLLISELFFDVLTSHDPNHLSVILCKPCLTQNCRSQTRYHTRNSPLKLNYIANFENIGIGPETEGVDIKHFFRIACLKDAIEFTSPVYAGLQYNTGINESRIIPDSQLPGLGDVLYQFNSTTSWYLKGTNDLPYGHPETRGKVDFTIETKEKFKNISRRDTIIVWAEITFKSATPLETIKTNEIAITKKSYRKYYNRNCICQQRFFLWRWICRLFKGI